MGPQRTTIGQGSENADARRTLLGPRQGNTDAGGTRNRSIVTLQTQLRHVYDTLPFYRRHYDQHGFHPDQVSSLDDFTARVPIITKQMLRDSQVAISRLRRLSRRRPSDVIRIHGSSGTSGKPTLYAFSRKDWDYVADVMAQGLYTCGVRPGDIVQLATVFSLFMGGWGALLGVERLGATAFPLGAGETERQLELMYRIGSTVLITTPTYALHMLETAQKPRIRPCRFAAPAWHFHRRARLVDPRNEERAGDRLGHCGAGHGNHVRDDALGNERRVRKWRRRPRYTG